MIAPREYEIYSQYSVTADGMTVFGIVNSLNLSLFFCILLWNFYISCGLNIIYFSLFLCCCCCCCCFIVVLFVVCLFVFIFLFFYFFIFVAVSCFIPNCKGSRLIGIYCIYPKSERTVWTRAEHGVIRVVTECLSPGNFR